MWTDFRRNRNALKMLRSYRAIVTASEHMRTEYLKHGFSEAVKVIPLPVERPGLESRPDWFERTRGARRHLCRPPGPGAAYRLLFVGRMELLKGGQVLLDALPSVLAAVHRPLQMTFVGDGRERVRWEEKAARLQSREPRLQVQFTGWLEGEKLSRTYADSDLLVVPSLWPEPFGLVGPEAGLHGLPAAAFAVGGVSQWLIDGINGYLASGDPPSAAGLAEAIIKCLRDPVGHAQLRRGACEVAGRFSMANHKKELMELLEGAAGAPSNRSETLAISNDIAG